MPEIDGFELLSRAKLIQPGCEFVVMTAFATVALAREALKMGAADFITKPFSIERELKPLVLELLGHEREVEHENEFELEELPEELGPRVQLACTVDREVALDAVIGRGPAMSKMLERRAVNELRPSMNHPRKLPRRLITQRQLPDPHTRSRQCRKHPFQ